eukprot:XP_001199146.1 PREDICTED: uncharacterized protein C3orf14 [Strongylocentrotus purpuratus]
METQLLEREIELNMKHEDIVSRREFLLQKSTENLNNQEVFQSSAASFRNRALKRNKKLIQDIDTCKESIKKSLGRPQPTELVTLKEKYWAMIEEELPAWKSDVKSAKKSNPSSAR